MPIARSVESTLWWDLARGMEVVQKETVDAVQYYSRREKSGAYEQAVQHKVGTVCS